MKNILTDHLNSTEFKQSYWQHGKSSFINSSILIYGGLLGILHAIFPFIFAFNTSKIVIKSFKKVIDSKRHKEDLNYIMPKGYILKKHLK